MSDTLPAGLKERELRELCTCAGCHRKIGKTGIPMLWKVSMERHMLRPDAIRRQTGLAMMLGGNGALAQVMGMDEDMTTPLTSTITVMVCDECACTGITLAAISERVGEERETSHKGAENTEESRP